MSTVLVVDDEQDILQTVEIILTEEGYTVVTAPGGNRALELVRLMSGHVVVLFDRAMPEGDGLYLLKEVADDEVLTGRHAYICMTATPRHRIAPEFTALMEWLGVALIAKPFDIDILVNAVADAHQRLLARFEAQLGDSGKPSQMWPNFEHPHESPR